MTSPAASLYKALNGVFCVYKPTNKSARNVVSVVCSKLAAGLNELDSREPRMRLEVGEAPEGSDDLPSLKPSVDWADHPLVAGPRYLPEDFRVGYLDSLGSFASGVFVMAIGHGCRLLPVIRSAKLIRTYHIKGVLGRASVDFTTRGNLLERSTYYHLNIEKLNRVVSSFQAGHQRHMFAAAGVDIDSEEAYNLAIQGLIRPTINAAGTVIYNIKVIDYKPPEFTLEIHCCNETTLYLLEMIHKIGLQSRTNATCTQIRCIRNGMFNLDHALLKKHWDPVHIVDNITDCSNALKQVDLKHSPLLQEAQNMLRKLGSGRS